MSSPPNIRIRPEILAELHTLANDTGRSPAELAEEALIEYVDYRRWKLERIRKGLHELENGAATIPHDVVCTRIEEKLRARLNASE